MYEKLKEFVNTNRNVIISVVALCLLCWGSYKWGYRNGSQVTDTELAEYIGQYKEQIRTAEKRIRDLEETNSRLAETNRDLEKSIEATDRIVQQTSNTTERIASYTDGAVAEIDRVIREMRQITETKQTQKTSTQFCLWGVGSGVISIGGIYYENC